VQTRGSRYPDIHGSESSLVASVSIFVADCLYS
jgi:hypothetical protein